MSGKLLVYFSALVCEVHKRHLFVQYGCEGLKAEDDVEFLLFSLSSLEREWAGKYITAFPACEPELLSSF